MFYRYYLKGLDTRCQQSFLVVQKFENTLKLKFGANKTVYTKMIAKIQTSLEKFDLLPMNVS